ncbi:MAG: cytochrome b/b6 domain-containing protein [Anaerolineales bacterium]|nr:cytochrome b/b6 domain-containing protein [Anaerolineales bacterium]
MSQSSTPFRYHSWQVTYHWLTALLIFITYIIGKVMTRMPNDDPSKLTPLTVHMVIGILVLLILIVRFIAQMKFPRPPRPAVKDIFYRLAKSIHHTLYLFIFIMTVSGIALALRANIPQAVLGSAALPENFNFLPHTVHDFLAPLLLMLILLHIGAALYHQFVLKDNLLARMGYGK